MYTKSCTEQETSNNAGRGCPQSDYLLIGNFLRPNDGSPARIVSKMTLTGTSPQHIAEARTRQPGDFLQGRSSRYVEQL